MELHVNKVMQAASGGSHVARYEAELELVPDSLDITIQAVEPRNALPGCFDLAIEAIRRGAEQVLRPLGMGAVIRIKSITLHPIDFKPRAFERYTAEELRRLLTIEA